MYELTVEIDGVQVSGTNRMRSTVLHPDFEVFRVSLEEILRERTPNKYNDNQLNQARKEYLCNWVLDNPSNRNLKKVPCSQYFALNEAEDYEALRNRIRNSAKTKGGIDKMVLLIRAHLQLSRGERTDSEYQDTEVTLPLPSMFIY